MIYRFLRRTLTKLKKRRRRRLKDRFNLFVSFNLIQFGNNKKCMILFRKRLNGFRGWEDEV
jgi:hypothetical protein